MKLNLGQAKGPLKTHDYLQTNMGMTTQPDKTGNTQQRSTDVDIRAQGNSRQ